jgi:hypothetical protein
MLGLGACPTFPKMTDWGNQLTVAESRSLILSQMRAPKFSCFLMSHRLLGKAFFKRATLRLPEPKTAVTIRLDRQVLN